MAKKYPAIGYKKAPRNPAGLGGFNWRRKMDNTAKCTICGEPMQAGEEMFKFHGYSGPCPKPPLPKKEKETVIAWTYWSNEMPIMEAGQCGVLHGRLFTTPEDARNFFSSRVNKEDVIVKVTVETC